jgi:hypothetical protein
MTEGIQHEFERAHTVPWRPEEFAIYRGVRLIAHAYEGITLVYFPGGAKKRLAELPGVVPPLKLRPKMVSA